MIEKLWTEEAYVQGTTTKHKLNVFGKLHYTLTSMEKIKLQKGGKIYIDVHFYSKY